MSAVINAAWLATVTVALASAASCGGGSKTGGTAPTPPPAPTGGNAGTVTITIANNAVSPKNVTVPRGERVTFVNNDSQPHDMQSDPHPTHTDCQEINQIGFLNPGQSRQTAPFNTVRTCGYHDHNRDLVESLKGTIAVN